MTITPSIQAFIPGGGNLLYANQCVPLWAASNIYIASTNAGDFWMSRFGITTGTEDVARDITALSADANPEPFGVDSAGRVYMGDSGFENFSSYLQLNADLTVRGQWGTPSTGWNVPAALPYPVNGWCATRQGNQALMVGASSVLTADPNPPMDTGYPLWVQTGESSFGYGGGPGMTSQINPFPCAGAGSDVWVITAPNLPGDIPQEINLWKYEFGTGVALIGTVSATDIDATWTHVYHAGIVYDATDGNVLVKVRTDDVVTNVAYIIKLRTSDGHLMWQVAVPNVDASPLQTSWGRIRHGTYCHFSTVGGQRVTVIDTAAGTSSFFTTGLAGVTGSIQCFDDTTGAIILSCGFSQTTGSPTLRGSTPTSFTAWAALYVSEFSPPPGGRTSYTRVWGNWR